MNSTGCQWISSNLSITGFTRDSAAFMTCKELIENAIDSTYNTLGAIISLRVDESGDQLRIMCSDNGGGFGVASVEALVNVFQSNKSSKTDLSCGKFGVGLKAMAYMSHEYCGSQISVISPVQGTDTSVSFSLRVAESSEIEIVETELLSGEDSTVISVCTPRPTDFHQFLRGVRDYMSELTVFRPLIELSLTINDEDGEIFHRGCAQLPRSVKHKDPSGMVECVLSICEKTRPGTESISTVSIVRFVNGVPLLCSHSSSCVVMQAAAHTIVRNGANIGLEFIGDGFSPSSAVSCKREVRVSSPNSTWKELKMRINILSPSAQVDYGSLLKDSVAGIMHNDGRPSLNLIVSRAVKVALRKIQNKFRTQLQSTEQYERLRARSSYIPSIVKNLSECVFRIRNPVCRLRLQELLSAGSSDFQEDLETELKRILMESLGGSIDDDTLDILNS
jgi:DNA topoisomerase VI subunit B